MFPVRKQAPKHEVHGLGVPAPGGACSPRAPLGWSGALAPTPTGGKTPAQDGQQLFLLPCVHCEASQAWAGPAAVGAACRGSGGPVPSRYGWESLSPCTPTPAQEPPISEGVGARWSGPVATSGVGAQHQRDGADGLHVPQG